MSNKEVLDVREAAELLGFSVWTVRDLAHKGEIPARKVGRAWRFSRSALIEHVQGEHVRGGGGGGGRPKRSERELKTFRLDPRHLKILRTLTDRMSLRDGTTYSQAQVLEGAIVHLWDEQIGEDIYAAFTIDEAREGGN